MARTLTRITAVSLACVALVVAGPTLIGPKGKPVKPVDPVTPKELSAEELEKLEFIDLGAGCFWCIEAVLERVVGVKKVDSGYMGGHVKDPTYKQVCEGTTGHAEIVRVHFDPEELPLEKLFEVFWQLHDPTTLNRQGADVGTQYRSAIFYHSEEQKAAAEKSKAAADKSGEFEDPIVTEITEASTFFPAEDYHQDFFEDNKTYPYCRAVIWPKLHKLGMLKDAEEE